MSEDKSQEFFGDGLTEEIITACQRHRSCRHARTPPLSTKGKSVNVPASEQELGVKYCLKEASEEWNQLRITAQLIDATTGNHLWQSGMDREMKDVFAIQDEINMKIINALAVTLTQGKRLICWQGPLRILEAYLKYLQGLSVSIV